MGLFVSAEQVTKASLPAWGKFNSELTVMVPWCTSEVYIWRH